MRLDRRTAGYAALVAVGLAALWVRYPLQPAAASGSVEPLTGTLPKTPPVPEVTTRTA